MKSGDYIDYFKVLGVERKDSTETIKRAFRKKARKYHPDVNPGDQAAEAKFKEINQAYEVLSDPEKRKRYEQYGQYWNTYDRIGSRYPSPTGVDVDFGSYGNFDDFINDLLGRFGGVSGSPGFQQPAGFPRNATRNNVNLDAEVTVRIRFSEAFHGAERTLSVNNERVKVRIPKGVKPGNRLRLKGKGNLQPGTGRRGDLYLKIDLESHAIWKLEGSLLRADLPIALDELVLGATITAMTPDGEAKVSIPPGTTPGKNLRLKGKGWPNGKERGDLIFTLKVDLPAAFSKDELDLLKEMQRIRSNDPRKAWLQSARI